MRPALALSLLSAALGVFLVTAACVDGTTPDCGPDGGCDQSTVIEGGLDVAVVDAGKDTSTKDQSSPDTGLVDTGLPDTGLDAPAD